MQLLARAVQDRDLIERHQRHGRLGDLEDLLVVREPLLLSSSERAGLELLVDRRVCDFAQLLDEWKSGNSTPSASWQPQDQRLKVISPNSSGPLCARFSQSAKSCW